jgi:hypothetical protein
LSQRRPNETLAVDICRQPLGADQLVAKLFNCVVIETIGKLYPAIGNRALSNEAPENFFQYPSKIHDYARLLPSCSMRTRNENAMAPATYRVS